MRAILYKGPLEIFLEDVQKPQPSHNEVLVKVKLAGICGSDVHYIKGKFNYSKVPIIPGHEGAGIVEAVGEHVKRLKKGDRVVINYVLSCGECYYCRIGRDNLCDKIRLIGFDLDGTWAEYTLVPERNLLKLPSNISFEYGAISGCALVTPFHAVKMSGLFPGESVAVIGLGGVGINAIPIVRMLGASKIIGIDTDPMKLDVAEKYGADLVIGSSEDMIDKVKEETNGGVDVCFEFVGSLDTIVKAIKITRKGGRVVLVGLTPDYIQINVPELLFNEKRILTSIDHTMKDLEELLVLMERGDLTFQYSISNIIKIEDVPHIIEKKIEGRYGGFRTLIKL